MVWLYKVIAFIRGFGFSCPKSGLKPSRGRGYAWKIGQISTDFPCAANMRRPETGQKSNCHKYAAPGPIGLIKAGQISNLEKRENENTVCWKSLVQNENLAS